MDVTTFAKLVVLVVLLGMFVAMVLITPRIWGSNAPAQPTTPKESDKISESKRGGRRA